MNVLTILMLLLLVVVISCSFKKEKFVEVFGFAGMKDDENKNIEINDSITNIDENLYEEQKKYYVTNDTINDVVILIRKYLKSNHKICAQHVETNYIHKYANKLDSDKILYKTRMMFLKTGGYPYGFSVSAEILMSPEPVLVGMYTQQMTNKNVENIKPFVKTENDEYENFKDIVAANVPIYTK